MQCAFLRGDQPRNGFIPILRVFAPSCEIKFEYEYEYEYEYEDEKEQPTAPLDYIFASSLF
jgi:hypothetical protein